MKKLLSLLALTCLTGCFADRSSLDTYQKSARLNNDVIDSYKQSESPTEEYVARVAKRIQTVSDRPTENVNIRVLETSDPELVLDDESKTISISKGALGQLRDEAELAATLSMAMARLENNQNADQETVQALYKAGYDPRAMLDLQQQYFYTENSNQAHWLNSVFTQPPTSATMDANKAIIDKMPKGLLRGSEIYQQHINNG